MKAVDHHANAVTSSPEKNLSMLRVCGNSYVTVVVKEDGMVSGVEVTESKHLVTFALDAAEPAETAPTATMTTLSTHSKSWSSLSTSFQPSENECAAQHEAQNPTQELHSPLYSRIRTKKSKRRESCQIVYENASPAYTRRGRGYKLLSKSADCLLDMTEESTHSESQSLRTYSSSGALRHQQAPEFRYPPIAWSPTDIRSVASLSPEAFFPVVDGKADCEERRDLPEVGEVTVVKHHGETLAIRKHEQLDVDEGDRFFAWSPSCVRSFSPERVNVVREPVPHTERHTLGIGLGDQNCSTPSSVEQRDQDQDENCEAFTFSEQRVEDLGDMDQREGYRGSGTLERLSLDWDDALPQTASTQSILQRDQDQGENIETFTFFEQRVEDLGDRDQRDGCRGLDTLERLSLDYDDDGLPQTDSTPSIVQRDQDQGENLDISTLSKQSVKDLVDRDQRKRLSGDILERLSGRLPQTESIEYAPESPSETSPTTETGENESETSIPSEVILTFGETCRSVSAAVKEPAQLFHLVKRENLTFRDSTSVEASNAKDNLLDRLGDWAAKNPFLEACSPELGSIQSSSFTDVESSLFSSCCSPTSYHGQTDLNSFIYNMGDPQGPRRLRCSTSSSITDILGEFEFRPENLQSLLRYSADDEFSGGIDSRPASSRVGTSMASSKAVSHTILELGETKIRTGDIRTLTLIMGQLAETMAREERAGQKVNESEELPCDGGPPSAFKRLPEECAREATRPSLTSTRSSSSVVDVKNDHGTVDDNLRTIMFSDRMGTSSTFTDVGTVLLSDEELISMPSVEGSSTFAEQLVVDSLSDDKPTDYTSSTTFSYEVTETESLSFDKALSVPPFSELIEEQDEKALYKDGVQCVPVKPAMVFPRDDLTAISPEEAAALLHDEDLRAMIMLSENLNGDYLLFPSYSLSDCITRSESDDGLHDEIGALHEDELREELEKAHFIMESIFPTIQHNCSQGATQSDFKEVENVEPEKEPEDSKEEETEEQEQEGCKEGKEEEKQEATLEEVKRPHAGRWTQLKISPDDVDSSTSSGSSTRRVRFSNDVEEFVFIMDARSPSEDSFDSFATFLSTRVGYIFYALRDLIDEYECGASDVETDELLSQGAATGMCTTSQMV